jgi:hypothetical protein
MARSPLHRLRRICLALPDAHEVKAWGEPTFRVRNKLFAMYADGRTHHGGGRHAVWVKATHLTQDIVVHRAPARYFVPPYVGPSGWFGMYLGDGTDWDEVTDRLREAYRLVAPKRLRAALDEERS